MAETRAAQRVARWADSMAESLVRLLAALRALPSAELWELP